MIDAVVFSLPGRPAFGSHSRLAKIGKAEPILGRSAPWEEPEWPEIKGRKKGK